MEKSGADVRVEKSEAICGDNDVYQIPNERKVEIFGNTDEQKQMAKQLILMEVGWAKELDGTIIKDDPDVEMRDRARKGLGKGIYS